MAWLGKGNALVELVRYGEALKCYDRAIEINPRYAEAWYNKGVALALLNRYAEAREALQVAQVLGNLEASQVLEKLRQLGY